MSKRAAEEALESPAHKPFVSESSTERTCTHDVAYPEGYEPPQAKQERSGKPAKEYPFTLDPFQREAVRALEAGESVMVSAHTSAGKTVVAEYAIAMALRDHQRVIYTSPIKALSNQKYRELAEEFSDVGLMTGDVTISPNASCLVMTTEILRSMQYRGSEVMREVAWIIFDEVHYMRDRERGVVWEESIVMAPKNAHFVFLSATVPNAKEFAEWVAKVHQQPCHIVYTDFRPTPLQHYIFPAGDDGLYLVVDEFGGFREDSFQKAVNAVQVSEKSKDGKWEKRRREEKGEASDIFKIVQMIILKQFDPVIVFSFSKRDCEDLAMQMSKLDLNNEDEKKLVDGIFWNAMFSLSDEDKKLPQVSLVLPFLKRGIGVHHSGLLPILKEVIEILFQEGLIKCLFATETFSIGLNMPAKTVVFTNVRKFDGDKFRWISSGEYIQMSGRAGRRGLDTHGICMLMLDEKLEPPVAKLIIKGSADSLNSAFHLSYNMILNQMRCEESNPEDLLRQSFHQFQSNRSLPTLENRVKSLEEERDSIIIAEEQKLTEYYTLLGQLRQLRADIRHIVYAARNCLPFLQPGRLVRILRYSEPTEEAMLLKEDPAVWGVIINFEEVKSKDSEDDDVQDKQLKYVVNVLVNCRVEKHGSENIALPVSLDQDGDPLVTSFPLAPLHSLSTVRIRITRDLRPAEFREHTLRSVLEVMERFPDGPPLLDPEDDMKIENPSHRKLVRRLEALESLVEEHPVSKSSTSNQELILLQKKKALSESIKIVRKNIRAASALAFKDELKARRRVLRRLGYANKEDLVELKGRVACEISSADELLLTELMFNGVFKDLSPEEAAALLSCFVWQEKTKAGKKLPEELAGIFSQLQDTAKRIGKVQLECKVPIEVDDYVNSFRSGIMEVVHAWCLGKSFLEVIKIADVFEGSLVRALRRLEEVLQQLVLASRSIGEKELEEKFESAITKMKRDIVFAASLYL